MHVHRDDLLEGGTKRRALGLLLQGVSSRDVFYAGTVMGHGALALAHACREHGKTAHIYICGDSGHPMMHKLRHAGALLHVQPPTTTANLHTLCTNDAHGGTVFPPGFDMPEFEGALASACCDIPLPAFSEVWTTAVTGTLTRALQKVWPDKPFKTVKVVKSPCDLGHAEIFTAPEKYHQPARVPPPYPSCPYTDAKLWQFAKDRAAPDSLIWNTAG
ncbi:MAG: hypothetical protein DI626_09085 [Micavibrio aeruginosavorus]|uniref:Tryptophan synthase beta chain-like PALP domain-containing protein n=1 Tax=Micavibrio aeruginosavorus TaxID=349221 RepID=A0A2W5BPS1_9BACT|nr:MAG: hypothetical protein DI626_09085 [Micavibrio aeruginosavorus]